MIRKRKPRLPQEPQKALIENFSHDGRGIARIDGKTTFIDGALPDETVWFQYTKRKKDYDEGIVSSIETPSAKRVKPGCPHYELCGGCSLQHLDAKAQIHEKQILLLDSLLRIGRCVPETVLEALESPSSWHYRNKARLSVRYVEKKQSTLIGFREKNKPRFIADINQCPVLNQRVDEQLMAMRTLINSFDDPRCIAQIEVAAGDEQVALIVRNVLPLSAGDEDKLRTFGQETQFLLFLQPSGPESIYLFYPENADGFLTYSLPEQDVNFTFYPSDFTQVNSKLNQKMVALALNWLELNSNDVVLDLFCGLGNFSLPIAKRCAQVVGVEGSQMMVERAYQNAKNNCITNATFLCENLEDPKALESVASYSFNKLLLDPPRTGAMEIVKRIDMLNPSRIVYVSCNPATLARDANILVNEQGYRLLNAGVMDMFPHTAHVESIAVFVKE